MSFKESFRAARLKSGLSQEKVGKAIHRTRNAIKGYEEGISNPNPDQLVVLCRLFNTTPNELLGFQCQQQNEDAKMCRLNDTRKKVIAEIEENIIEIEKEIDNLDPSDYCKLSLKLRAIKDAREMIKEYQMDMEAQS